MPGSRHPAEAQDATIDGELVVCDGAGIADFERLHSREHDHAAFLYAFDLLGLDGVDVRPLPLAERKGRLRQVLQGCPSRHPVQHIEGDGAEIFAHACKLGFESIVSKDRARPMRRARHHWTQAICGKLGQLIATCGKPNQDRTALPMISQNTSPAIVHGTRL